MLLKTKDAKSNFEEREELERCRRVYLLDGTLKETKFDEIVYAKKSLADLIRRLGHREVQVLRDQDPILIALVESIVAECNKLGIVDADPRDGYMWASPNSHASLGAKGRAQQTRFAVKANGYAPQK